MREHGSHGARDGAPGAPRAGTIEVICGSMFSGKSEELIRRLRRALIARQRVQIFKPILDDRYADDFIVSHSEQRIAAVRIRSATDLLARLDSRADVVGIDEVQFLEGDLVALCQRLADDGRRVIVAGLDQDFLGRPFDPVPRLMAVAEYVTKALAVCVRCGAPANRSQRLVADEARVVVGASDIYEARCRGCFDPDLSRQPGMGLDDRPAPASGSLATEAEAV